MASVLTLINQLNGVDNGVAMRKHIHTGEAGHCQCEGSQSLAHVHHHIWVVGISESCKSKSSKAFELGWVHLLPLKDKVAEGASVTKIIQSIDSHHFFCEVLVCVEKPFQILSFNLEGESFVLFDGSMLDLIELIELLLEYVKVTALLCVKINVELLILLERVDYFVELRLIKEESVVPDLDTSFDLLDWHAQSFLVEEFLERLLSIRFKLCEQGSLLGSNDILCNGIVASIRRQNPCCQPQSI